MTWTARALVPSLGGETRSREFTVEADSFLDAVAQAELVREDDERLVSVALSAQPAPTTHTCLT